VSPPGRQPTAKLAMVDGALAGSPTRQEIWGDRGCAHISRGSSELNQGGQVGQECQWAALGHLRGVLGLGDFAPTDRFNRRSAGR